MKNTTESIESRELVDLDNVRNHFLAALVHMGIGILAGLAFSLQFLQKYPFPGVEYLAAARVRLVHVNSVVYGLIANGLFAIVSYVIPKLTGVPVLSKRLSTLCFWVYNALVAVLLLSLLGGQAKAITYAEAPEWLAPIIAVAAVLFIVNVITPIWKSRHKTLYVSLWYILAALIWTPLVYVMGNFLPQYVFPGTAGAAITSMFIHDLVGLFVTPIGIAAVYYLLPVVMRVPLYSHALSIIGFWGLAFFYPLNSAHHYLYSPIPMWAQYASIVASIGVHVVVYTVVFNIFATMASDWKQLQTNIPVRWIFTGTICYLITCIQCAVQVTLSAQAIIHFTDWVVGHAHFVLFGTFTFWITAWMYWFLPRRWGTPIYSLSLARWHFWLATVGIVIMQFDLLAAGVMQGVMWRSLLPFIDSIRASVPFWWTRTFSGVLILSGEFCFFVNLYLTWQEGRASKSAPATGTNPAGVTV